MKGHEALRLVIQWLSVLFWLLLYSVIQKNKRKGTEVNEFLVFGLNELYSIFVASYNTGNSKPESSYVNNP